MDQVLARGGGERIGERGLFPLRDALAQHRRALVQRGRAGRRRHQVIGPREHERPRAD